MRKREGIERRQERPLIGGMIVEADTLKRVEGKMMNCDNGEQFITPSASKTSACIQGSCAEPGRTCLSLKGVRN